MKNSLDERLDEYIVRRTCEYSKQKLGQGSQINEAYFTPNEKKPTRFMVYGDFGITIKQNPGEILVEIDHCSQGNLMGLSMLLADQLPVEERYKTLVSSVEKVRDIRSNNLKLRIYLKTKDHTEEVFQAVYKTALQPLMILMLPRSI